jgi:UDP-N-acetylglucosamine 2-epimerase (non-hydrolysing)
VSFNRTLSPIAVVIGTRPEIVKLAHIVRILGTRAGLIHSGQYTDTELSGVLLAGAGRPAPHMLSGICGEPRFAQVGRITEQLGELFARQRPAAVVVQGDTSTAMAAAQAGNYCSVPVVHVEAGLRSYGRDMPEEINRCIIGVLASLHCAPTRRAADSLAAEGVPAARIALTGNTIVEATLAMLPGEAAAREIAAAAGAEPDRYVLATIHRPENTDDPRLGTILDELGKLGLPVLVPLHPRTRLAVARHGLGGALDRLRVLPPADHRTFLGLARQARLLVSDSGGVQEECTVLKRPLIVVRNSTERPESVEAGLAHLDQPGPVIGALGRELSGDEGLAARLAARPCPYGGGTASEQIAGLLRGYLR